MNEVTKIHLGSQAFTISVDAQHELRAYLNAIQKAVKEKDVVQEIEVRMAELLSEHGINKEKVILPSDVEYLKSQLGSPKDFSEEDEEESIAQEGRRLFRDTDNAIVAGVSSGLSKYLGVDALLIRILFIIFTVITAGWGILLYIILWLLIPEAKTSSDKLRMAGKPVTVSSIKETVEEADVKGAVSRANATLAGPINNIFRIILKLAGIVLMVFGLSAIFGIIGSISYLIIDGSTYAQNNIFPIGYREHLALYLVMLVIGLLALFPILFGLAIFRRKWPIPTWVTGVLIGLVLISASFGAAMIADVYPEVRDRYQSNTHTAIRNSEPFSNVNVINQNGVNINFYQASTYYITFSYYSSPDLNNIKTYVKNGILNIDTSQYDQNRNCSTICIPNSYNVTMNIYSPNSNSVANDFYNGPSVPAVPTKPYYNWQN